MRTIVDGFVEMVRLVGDTFRLWWRNLLPMTTWWLGGFVGFTVSINAAIWLAAHAHQSLGTGVFAAGVLCQIIAAVGMIRTCAMSLYRWRDAASSATEETSDPMQHGLLELLAVTLLPLVAVWSAWGFFDDQVNQLGATFLVEKGTQSTFFQLGIHSWHKYLPALVVLLILRRLLQAVDDRWPSRPVKFAQVWSEAFFVLLTAVITPFAVGEGKLWFKERSFWYWSVDWWGGLKDFFESIRIPLPAGIEFLWGFFWETLWPLFKLGIGEPLTWLAITTVVFGHRVLSSGGVFRGTRLERRLGSQPDPEVAQPNRFVALTYKAPDLVLGGLREKFYPALNAFRLLVRVGPVFLGVVCMVYTFWLLGQDWAFVGIQRAIGIHGMYWGLMNIQISDLIRDIIFQPLRIALLAAAFDLCISVGIQRRNEAAAQKAAEAQPAKAPATA